MALGLQAGGVVMHRTTDFVEDILQLARLREHALSLREPGLARPLVRCHVHYRPTVVQ
ncbi:hypothetical protein MKOR_27630 [Mycolicibacillus koreensis]|nr:hypothetical protein MKOR_27630 [Mycolicibacillus koreensis]